MSPSPTPPNEPSAAVAQVAQEPTVELRALHVAVTELGDAIIGCRLPCEGVTCDPARGILPRGLHLDDGDADIARACIVIGMNPGKADPDEEAHLRGIDNYDLLNNYWLAERREKHNYYTKIRGLLLHLGITGPILYTEVAKCQSEPELTKPPIQTLRTCARQFLTHEVGLVSAWPIIAFSEVAFTAAAYLFSDRAVLGFPHPTGSGGVHFKRLFVDGVLVPDIKQAATEALAKGPPHALWLSQPAGKRKTKTS